MTVPETGPRRIVSLLASATEILYALGLGERVVAVSHECDYPPDAAVRPKVTCSRVCSGAASKAIDEQVRTMIEAGLPLYEIDVEQIVALRPDRRLAAEAEHFGGQQVADRPPGALPVSLRQ